MDILPREKFITLLISISFVIPGVFSVEIRKDPSMREGEPSFIYCDVGTITTGVVVYTRPSNTKANCLGPGNPCASNDYTATQNTSGVLLTISSVDSARETGTWYCEQTPDQSNDLTLRDKKIGGNLVRNGFTNAGPTGSVDSYTATMVLSCIDTTPSYGFSYTVNGSSSASVPAEAVRIQTPVTYEGTTCEAGNTFYVLTLTASNSLNVFNNQQDVKFTFTYYGSSITTTFSANFLQGTSDSTTGGTGQDSGDSTTGGTGQECGVSTTTNLGPGLAIGFGVTIPVIVVLVIVIIVMYRRNTTDKTLSTNVNQQQTANADVGPAAPVDRSTYAVLDNTSRTQDYADLQSPAVAVDRSTYAGLDNTARTQDYAELKEYANTEVSSKTYQNV